MMTIVISSSWITIPDCTYWLNLVDCSLYSNMGKTLLEISSHIHYHQMDGKIQSYDIFEINYLGLEFSIMMMSPLKIILSCVEVDSGICQSLGAPQGC
jgi:hypothetical protein